jgi:hypothetical protein
MYCQPVHIALFIDIDIINRHGKQDFIEIQFRLISHCYKQNMMIMTGQELHSQDILDLNKGCITSTAAFDTHCVLIELINELKRAHEQTFQCPLGGMTPRITGYNEVIIE